MSADDRPVSLARRVTPALLLAGAGGVLFSALDNPAHANVALSTSGATTAPTTAAPPATTPRGGATSPTAPPATTRPGNAASPTSTVPQPPARGGSGAAPSTTVPATAAPASCAGGTTKTGPSVSTRFGPVQVAATVANGKLCDVQALSWPNGDRRSQGINQQAIPMLHDLALQAGSASFSNISGATITTTAYKQSLQAALDAR